MKQHQNTILWQVNEKQELKRQQLLEDMETERKKRLQELEYQMMIEREKDKRVEDLMEKMRQMEEFCESLDMGLRRRGELEDALVNLGGN